MQLLASREPPGGWERRSMRPPAGIAADLPPMRRVVPSATARATKASIRTTLSSHMQAMVPAPRVSIARAARWPTPAKDQGITTSLALFTTAGGSPNVGLFLCRICEKAPSDAFGTNSTSVASAGLGALKVALGCCEWTCLRGGSVLLDVASAKAFPFGCLEVAEAGFNLPWLTATETDGRSSAWSASANRSGERMVQHG